MVTVTELTGFVTRLAASQRGLVRVDQVREEDRARLRHLARRGVIEHAAKGVYRMCGAPDSWEQRVTAAAWALGPEALLSHAAAARWYGWDGFADDRLDFLLPRPLARRATPNAVVHSAADLARVDVRTLRGMRITSPTRTIVDLSRHGAPAKQIEQAIDSAIERRQITLDRLVMRVAAVNGSARWGLAALEAALLDAGGHSVLERAFLGLVRRAGLPRLSTQVVHRNAGRHVARVDFLFASDDLVVEVSGGRGHSSPSARAKDASRRNELQRLGRTVFEFTYEQVVGTPDEVTASLRAAIG